jgi:hypothetical protein
MTISLLLREEGQVAPEDVEGLLPNSELTQGSNSAYESGAGGAFHDLSESGVHSIASDVRDAYVWTGCALQMVALLA